MIFLEKVIYVVDYIEFNWVFFGVDEVCKFVEIDLN